MFVSQVDGDESIVSGTPGQRGLNWSERRLLLQIMERPDRDLPCLVGKKESISFCV
jgi:hypothetical protein